MVELCSRLYSLCCAMSGVNAVSLVEGMYFRLTVVDYYKACPSVAPGVWILLAGNVLFQGVSSWWVKKHRNL